MLLVVVIVLLEYIDVRVYSVTLYHIAWIDFPLKTNFSKENFEVSQEFQEVPMKN